MRIILSLLLSLVPLLAEDFISEFEYGQMLYRDPRGVSCVPCHGDTGEGREIASYRNSKRETIKVTGPDIREATLAQIRTAILKGPGLMPRYFLTDKEVQTIYAYLQKVNAKVPLEETQEAEPETQAEDSMAAQQAAPTVKPKRPSRPKVSKKPAQPKPKKKKINPWEGMQ